MTIGATLKKHMPNPNPNHNSNRSPKLNPNPKSIP